MALDRLIIVAGYSGVGKSYLIDHLRRGEHTELQQTIQLKNADSWPFQEIATVNLPVNYNLLLHYDILRPRNFSKTLDYGNDVKLHEILSNAASVTVLTLWTPAKMTRARWDARLKAYLEQNHQRVLRYFPEAIHSPLISVDFTLHLMKRPWKFSRRYQCYNEQFINSVYKKWLEFCDGLENVEHWLVDVSGPSPVLGQPANLVEKMDSSFSPQPIQPKTKVQR